MNSAVKNVYILTYEAQLTFVEPLLGETRLDTLGAIVSAGLRLQ